MSGGSNAANASAVPTNVSTETNILSVPIPLEYSSSTIGQLPTTGAQATVNKAVLSGMIELNPGTGTTTVNVKGYAGVSGNGTSLGSFNVAVTAGTKVAIPFKFVANNLALNSPVNTGQPNVMTVALTQGGAPSAAGTADFVAGEVRILS